MQARFLRLLWVVGVFQWAIFVRTSGILSNSRADGWHFSSYTHLSLLYSNPYLKVRGVKEERGSFDGVGWFSRDGAPSRPAEEQTRLLHINQILLEKGDNKTYTNDRGVKYDWAESFGMEFPKA